MSNSNITKKALAASFKELMATTPFDKISILSITDRCGLNRQSFYYHFQDKFELINWIFETEVIATAVGGITDENWSERIRDLLTIMQNEKAFYTNAIKHTNNEFSKYLLSVTKSEYIDVIKQLQEIKGKSIPEDDEFFISSFFAHGTSGIIIEWIENDMSETPEKMAGRFESMVERFRELATHQYLK